MTSESEDSPGCLTPIAAYWGSGVTPQTTPSQSDRDG